MKGSIFLFFVFISSALLAQEKYKCFHSKVKYNYFQKLVLQNEKVCVGKRPQVIRSQNCMDGKCQALKMVSSKMWRKKFKMSGNPGFTRCKDIGGSPQIMSYLSQKGEWVGTSRCLFEDKSFVNIASIK